ncbi:MAG: outer membrane lipoprotein-sorting protein, partial [Bacteroidota bacterium]
YDFDDELFKTITHKEFRKLDESQGKYMVTHMHAMNHRKNRSSEMVMDQVVVTETNKSCFTVAYLEKE